MLTRAAVIATALLVAGTAPASAQTRDRTIRVDPLLAPAIPRLAGAVPPGRIADAAGPSDVVRDEIIVSTDSRAELDGVLARWNGTLLDSTEPDRPGGIVDHLVRISPGPAPDPEAVAADLEQMAPRGSSLRVDSASTLRIVGAVARENAHHGIDVGLNWIARSDAIADGTLVEDDDAGNPFDWKYVATETAQKVGLDAAWQLLEARGKLAKRNVDMLISDGGFKVNDDFPSARVIVDAEWDDENPATCTNGASCPYHGASVVLAAMGQHDNGYGTAGVAGPIARLTAVELQLDMYRNFERLEELVRQHDPEVVNMSYSFMPNVDAAEAADRHFERMVANGALLVASAGNDGDDVDELTCVKGVCSEAELRLPCESRHVLCVGGVNAGTTDVSGSSAWGSDDDSRSVEIYGPYCTRGLTGATCGTSFSSPFVAGVAALVKAANPALGPGAIREILLDTAHWGVNGSSSIGSQRRINAAGAVARALGVTITDPVVKISSPLSGKQYSVSSWVTLSATATDFRDAALPIQWHSSRDGNLVTAPKAGPVTVPGGLSPGTHTITATATDIRGVSRSAKVQITVVKQAPLVSIVAPAPGTPVYTSEPLRLTARSMDPDANWAQLPESSVSWQVRRLPDLAVVAQAPGHDTWLAPGLLAPGAYSIRFRGNLGSGATDDDVTTVIVKPVPAGESVPRPVIVAPVDGLQRATIGHPVTVHLSAYATDAQDGALSGRRLRWVARAGEYEQVLCTGSSFPGAFDTATGPAFGSLVDCAEFDARLLPPPTGPVSQDWSVELEAVDSAGLIGRTNRIITIRHVVT